MKKAIISIILMIIIFLMVIIEGININNNGIMINFVDKTGYWIEF